MNVTAYRRGRTVRTIAASMLAVAALGLTAACGGGEDGGSDNAGKANSSASAPAGKTAKGGSAGAKDAKDAKDAKTQAQKAEAGSEEEPIGDCDINKTVFSVQKVKNPINHLLLKATNGAGVDCKLVGYPGLKFGESAQAATPVNEDSQPQSVVMLAPGESAYAGITTSAGDGSGSGGSDVNSLEVFVDGSEDPVSVELPGGSVYIDSAAQVTYWQTTAQDALTW
ncbi:DUF4232 domain-containing protein [Streptomyces sp. PSAA01]|uniref:DUF4232 domain-containing protein n=1 Tax=Streptomyces sp. PSAA01 TaxID=2912762 RepID=UPI001F3E5400|nr:DUF4232 domain-containing protein [Streptomyces sp. PSAA01]MCG0284801.1 DUF4232 domain-containing protein [Streptomyces sp. PSAA01]